MPERLTIRPASPADAAGIARVHVATWRDAYAGMRGASEDYALLQARAIRDNFGAQWGLAESGSVGGSSHPSGAPAGRSCAAVAGPDGFEFVRVTETGGDERIANMEAFARAALQTLEDALRG